MNIQFTIKNEPILLRSDELSYELCRQKSCIDKDTGQPVIRWVPFKFFANLDRALNKLIDLKVRSSDARTLAELKTVIEAAREEVCRTWRINKEGTA